MNEVWIGLEGAKAHRVLTQQKLVMVSDGE